MPNNNIAPIRPAAPSDLNQPAQTQSNILTAHPSNEMPSSNQPPAAPPRGASSFNLVSKLSKIKPIPAHSLKFSPQGIVDTSSVSPHKVINKLSGDSVTDFFSGYMSLQNQGLRQCLQNKPAFFTAFQPGSFLADALFPTTKASVHGAPCISAATYAYFLYFPELRMAQEVAFLHAIESFGFRMFEDGNIYSLPFNQPKDYPPWLKLDDSGIASRDLLRQMITSLSLLGNVKLALKLCQKVEVVLNQKGLVAESQNFASLRQAVSKTAQQLSKARISAAKVPLIVESKALEKVKSVDEKQELTIGTIGSLFHSSAATEDDHQKIDLQIAVNSYLSGSNNTKLLQYFIQAKQHESVRNRLIYRLNRLGKNTITDIIQHATFISDTKLISKIGLYLPSVCIDEEIQAYFSVFDKNGDTPLMSAARKGDLDTMDALINIITSLYPNNAKIALINPINQKRSALTLVCQLGHSQAVKKLLAVIEKFEKQDKAAILEHQIDPINSALSIAARKKDPSMVNALLKAGGIYVNDDFNARQLKHLFAQKISLFELSDSDDEVEKMNTLIYLYESMLQNQGEDSASALLSFSDTELLSILAFCQRKNRFEIIDGIFNLLCAFNTGKHQKTMASYINKMFYFALQNGQQAVVEHLIKLIHTIKNRDFKFLVFDANIAKLALEKGFVDIAQSYENMLKISSSNFSVRTLAEVFSTYNHSPSTDSGNLLLHFSNWSLYDIDQARITAHIMTRYTESLHLAMQKAIQNGDLALLRVLILFIETNFSLDDQISFWKKRNANQDSLLLLVAKKADQHLSNLFLYRLRELKNKQELSAIFEQKDKAQDSFLLIACKKRDDKSLNYFLNSLNSLDIKDKIAILNQRDGAQLPLLVSAAKSGNVKIIKRIFESFVGVYDADFIKNALMPLQSFGFSIFDLSDEQDEIEKVKQYFLCVRRLDEMDIANLHRLTDADCKSILNYCRDKKNYDILYEVVRTYGGLTNKAAQAIAFPYLRKLFFYAIENNDFLAIRSIVNHLYIKDNEQAKRLLLTSSNNQTSDALITAIEQKELKLIEILLEALVTLEDKRWVLSLLNSAYKGQPLSQFIRLFDHPPLTAILEAVKKEN